MLGTLRAARQLRQRLIVKPMEHVAKLIDVGDLIGEILTVGSAQRSDPGIAVRAADGAVLIAVALIEARLLHWVPPEFGSRQTPWSGVHLQPFNEYLTSDGKTERAWSAPYSLSEFLLK
jgi:hypothetical protein